MEFEVRRINESEATLLREVRLASLKDAPFAFGANFQDEQQKPLAAYVSDAKRLATSETSTLFFALNNKKVVGQIGAFLASDTAYICAMWVSPAARRSKAGSTLFGSASDWLADLGAKEIYAWVADSNTNAVAFYESLGFTATDKAQPLPSNPSESETLYVFYQ